MTYGKNKLYITFVFCKFWTQARGLEHTLGAALVKAINDK